jgi:hypothetical protein
VNRPRRAHAVRDAGAATPVTDGGRTRRDDTPDDPDHPDTSTTRHLDDRSET